jgi:hypothetical protein
MPEINERITDASSMNIEILSALWGLMRIIHRLLLMPEISEDNEL